MTATAQRRPASDYAIVGLIAFLLAWTLGLYHGTTASMIAIWERSETFAHGFIVIPIFLFLVWRERLKLAEIEPSPCFPALLGLIAAGAAWVLGEQMSALALSQLAMISMVPLAIWTVCGTRVAKTLAYPFAFLLFAVPFGEFLVPRMVDWTADFTVFALRASNVPVYREGNFFMIPTGAWSVVEACSGLRYLIASLMVGVLFAYLSYRSPWRRAAFIAASVAVPVIANWLRAYMIVMLGHLSGNRLATGVDHLVYGWIFFGLVMLLLFWIGGRWREDHYQVQLTEPAKTLTGYQAPRRNAVLAALVAVLAVTAVWPLLAGTRQQDAAKASVLLEAPTEAGGWKALSEPLSNWRPDVTGASAELQQTFARGDERVVVYIAFFRNQTRGAKAITSTNQLVRTSNKVWGQRSAGTAEFTSDDQVLSARTAVVTSGVTRLAVWQWFWVDGRLTSNHYAAWLYQALSLIRGHGDPVAWVVIYAPTSAEESDVRATLQGFATAMGSSLDAAIQRAASAP